MITLKKLQLHNFLSHKNTIIIFKEDEKILIDGKSGSGKSSIVEAIVWSLYGEARVENRSLVKHGEKSASVIINLYDDENETHYEINRGTTDKAKNTLNVQESDDGSNYTPIKANGLRDIQEYLEKNLLRASYTLFINSIAYPQDNINNFVKQTASKRKDLLLEIANVADFDLYYNRSRDLLTLKNEEKVRIETSINTNLGFIESNKPYVINENGIITELFNVQASIDAKTKERDDLIQKGKEIDLAREKITKIQAQLSTKKVEVETLSEQKKKKEEKIQGIKGIDIEKIKEKVWEGNVLKEKKAVLDGKIKQDYERTNRLNAILSDKPTDRDYDGEVLEINKNLIPLIKDSGKCPSGDKCPFVVPIQNQINYLSEKINEKIAAKAKLEKEKTEYMRKISEIPPFTLLPEEREIAKRLEEDLLSYHSFEVALQNAEYEMKELPVLSTEFAEMEGREEKLKLEIDCLFVELKMETKDQEGGTPIEVIERRVLELRNAINDLLALSTSLNSKLAISKNARETISKIEEKIKNEQDDLSKVNSSLDALYLIKEAFGSKGLKTVVIDYLIPRLEDKINDILSKLSDFRVQLDTQKGTADGEGTIEGLFINIFNDRGEQFDFANYSGGERLKITVAISEALASLQKCGFRIMDEVFIGLDEESVEHFAEVMDQLQEKFKQIICISHLRTIKDLFDSRVEIIKINGGSQIKENEGEIKEEKVKEIKIRKKRITKV